MVNGFVEVLSPSAARGERPCYHVMIKDKHLTSILERRKTFDSLLANHFSPVRQSSLIKE
jgi:hypothetical protein